jgi:hypothetical protein
LVTYEPLNLWRIQTINKRKSGENLRARGERFGKWPKLKEEKHDDDLMVGVNT